MDTPFVSSALDSAVDADSPSISAAASPSGTASASLDASFDASADACPADGGRRKGMADGLTVKMSPGFNRVLGFEHWHDKLTSIVSRQQ